MTSTNERLFACTNCLKKCKFEDLSSSQQLCKGCRKQFPSVTCTYCRLEFHPIKNSTDKESRPACEHCARDFKQYGTPSFCTTCNLQSAFNGKKCSRCLHSEKKYGPPAECEHCKLVCAFQKPDDVKKKVDGKTLCLLCTINYKKAQFKKKSQEHKPSSSSNKSVSSTASSISSATSKSKHHHHSSSKPASRVKDTDGEPALKKLKLDKHLAPVRESSPSTQPLSLLGRESQPMDMLSSNHVLETDKLQNEISTLKKQLVQKEQALLEKDKQICQLKADAHEKEKDFRTKQQGQQKAHTDVVEQLQSEIRSLRTQLSKASQKKTSGGSNSDKQNSIKASLANSLAATPNSVSST